MIRKIKKFLTRKSFSAAFAAILIQIISIQTAQAATITWSGGQAFHAPAAMGQTFTMPSNGGVLTSIAVTGLYFRFPTYQGCVKAKLYVNPSKTTLLDTSTNSICDTSGTSDFNGTAGSGSFNFTGNVSLSANTQYYYEVYIVSGSSNFFLDETYVGYGTDYSGGNVYLDGVGDTNFDMTFVITYTEVVVSAPTNSVLPAITGTPTYGQVLSASSGTWTNSPTSYGYQWSRASTSGGSYSNIPSATSSTYTLTSSDVGQFIKVTVTATNSGGSGSAISAATANAISSATSSVAFASPVGEFFFRTLKVISVTPTVAGKLTFKANNVVIAGCKNLIASANVSKLCSFKPSRRGAVTFSVTLVPTDTGYASSTQFSSTYFVKQRVGNR